MICYRPDIIAYEELIPSDHIGNLNNAFDVASNKLGIHKILDAEGEEVDFMYTVVFQERSWLMMM